MTQQTVQHLVLFSRDFMNLGSTLTHHIIVCRDLKCAVCTYVSSLIIRTVSLTSCQQLVNDKSPKYIENLVQRC